MHKGLFSVPAEKAEVITPSDTTVYSPIYRAVYVGTGGNVTVLPSESLTPVTFSNVVDGSILPVSVSKVLSTGTTASNIIGLR